MREAKALSVKLKPCPFCGGEAMFLTPVREPRTAFDRISVECKHCGAHPYTLLVYSFESIEEKQASIAEEWNRRANDEH
jgi:Lar family restriction alleviation protein